MLTLGALLDEVAAVVDAYDDDKKKQLKNLIQIVYYQLCEKKSWSVLRRTMSLDFSSADSDGIWLPANLAGIDYVGDSNRRYHRVDYPVEGDERYRYYISDICVSPLSTARRSIKSGATSFTPAISASNVGEYIRFGKNPGFYLTDSTTSISTKFRGEQVNEKSEVRPEGTKKISCVDDDASQITSSVTLYYWVYPSPLWDEEQRIMLPDTRAMELAVMARAIGELDHRTEDAKDLRFMFPKAYEEMQRSDEPFIAPTTPENRYGDVSGWGATND